MGGDLGQRERAHLGKDESQHIWHIGLSRTSQDEIPLRRLGQQDSWGIVCGGFQDWEKTVRMLIHYYRSYGVLFK